MCPSLSQLLCPERPSTLIGQLGSQTVMLMVVAGRLESVARILNCWDLLLGWNCSLSFGGSPAAWLTLPHAFPPWHLAHTAHNVQGIDLAFQAACLVPLISSDRREALPSGFQASVRSPQNTGPEGPNVPPMPLNKHPLLGAKLQRKGSA